MPQSSGLSSPGYPSLIPDHENLHLNSTVNLLSTETYTMSCFLENQNSFWRNAWFFLA